MQVCLLWWSGAPVLAAEFDADQIVREVNAKRLATVFGEVELGKQGAMETLAFMAKENPKVPGMFWTRIGATLDLDALETAIGQHYAARFSAEELKYLVAFFNPPEMRGLMYWVRMLATNPPSEADMPAHLERIKKQYGAEPMRKLGELFNTALGRTLMDVQKSAAEIRRKEVIAALVAAQDRVNRR